MKFQEGDRVRIVKYGSAGRASEEDKKMIGLPARVISNDDEYKLYPYRIQIESTGQRPLCLEDELELIE